MSEPKDHSQTPLDQLRLAELGPRDKISTHFRLYELSISELADRQGIDNRIPDDATLRTAVHLARSVLEPVRVQFGALTPNSVYRSQALERALKNKPASWISTSPHTRGCACDIEIVAKPTLEFASWCAENLPDYDQIICECYDPSKGPNAGWVHVGLNPPGRANRRQCLSYVTDPRTGRLVYVPGLQADTA